LALNLSKIAATVEKYMIDTVTISRKGAVTAIDPITLRATDAKEIIYAGPAFVAPQGSPVVTVVGNKPVTRIIYEIGIPRTAPDILPNDEILVTDSEDHTWEGIPIISDGSLKTTYLTHRRIGGHWDTVNG